MSSQGGPTFKKKKKKKKTFLTTVTDFLDISGILNPLFCTDFERHSKTEHFKV